MKRLTPRNRFCRLLLPVILSFCAASVAIAATPFSKIVVFGDSFNDRGNMTAFTGGVFPNAPTYVEGRQSNGPVWVEYLAARLGMADKIQNYAVVGAMTKATTDFPTGNVWSDTFPGLEGTDVETQVLDFIADSGGAADPAALYILEGGANDFPRVANPAVIIYNLVESLVRLQSVGARHIIVVNLPDIGKTPRLILAEQLGLVPPGTGAYVSGACAQLNQGLAGAVAAATFPGAVITIADLYAFMNTVSANPSAFGLVNTQAPYLLFGAGADPSTWLFWDDLHPTTRGHEIFAEEAITSLVETYSPSRGNTAAPGAVNGLNGLLRKPRK